MRRICFCACDTNVGYVGGMARWRSRTENVDMSVIVRYVRSWLPQAPFVLEALYTAVASAYTAG